MKLKIKERSEVKRIIMVKFVVVVRLSTIRALAPHKLTAEIKKRLNNDGIARPWIFSSERKLRLEISFS